MCKFSIVFACLILCFSSFAKPKSSAFQMNLGAFYSSKRVFRGALIWDAPIIAMGPSFTFYNTISVGGNGGLSVFKTFSELHTVSVGLSAFDDNEPNGPMIVLENKQEDFKNQRTSTFGTFLKYSFRYQQYISATLSYEKDLKRHKGGYFDGRISTSIIPLLTLGILGSIGDKSSNTYAYGPQGVSGIGHIGLLGSVFLPFLPWGGKLILNFTHTKITQSKNGNADFIRGSDSHSNLSVISTWNLY